MTQVKTIKYPFYVTEYYTNGKIHQKMVISGRKISYRINRMLDWEKIKKVYLKILYGYDIDNYGHRKLFYNDGDYTNKKDFNLAFIAFSEGLKKFKSIL
jgi:hypothetical protein